MKIYSTWLDPNKWGPYIEEYQRQMEQAMKDDTLNAITEAILALKEAQDCIEADRAETRERLREKVDLANPGKGYHWAVWDDPDAPRFTVSVSKIVPEGGKLPEPTEEARLLRAERVPDGEEEGGS